MTEIKICYLINVPWRHIFQRPQVFPLFLEKDYSCVVVQKFWIAQIRAPRQSIAPRKMISIFQLPKSDNIKILQKITDYYSRRIIIRVIKNSNVLWICHPGEYKYIPDGYPGVVIYDCMDFHRDLGTKKRRYEAELYEKALIQRANLVFASSNQLVNYLEAPEKTHLIRNGYLASEKEMPIKDPVWKETYTICYFGTVSSWFDFDLIEASLEKDEAIEYKIIGPAKKNIIEEHASKKVIFTGPVEHSVLAEAIRDCDAFIMPFQVNDLILAVDPVKLYEYIHFGKCIISVWYPEIDRFKPFVYFYRNTEEFLQTLQQLKESGFPAKYSEEQRRSFMAENSWEHRYALVKKQIDNVCKKAFETNLGTFETQI